MGNCRCNDIYRCDFMKNTFHGGNINEIKLKYPDVKKSWIDLSTGLNPNAYPWQEKIPHEMLSEAAHLLPQYEIEEKCKKTWLNYLSAEMSENWLLIPGSQAFINILPDIFPNYHALIPIPNYGEHERVWQGSENGIEKLTRDTLNNHQFEPRTLLILTNPNNPDGYNWSPEYLLELAHELKKKDGILVIDEAFSDVIPNNSLASLSVYNNIIILRSFGKFFGLGGIRLGMVRASSKIIEKTKFKIGPWAVNGLALTIAQNAFNDEEWIRKTKHQLKSDMIELKKILNKANFKIIGGTDLFCLVEHENAIDINITLNNNGIVVRVFNDKPTLLRFGLFKNKKEAIRLKEALN